MVVLKDNKMNKIKF